MTSTAISLDTKQDLTGVVINRETDKLQFEFQRLLNTEDSTDQVISPSGKQFLLYAFGRKSGTTFDYHGFNNKGSVYLDLGTCSVDQPTTAAPTRLPTPNPTVPTPPTEIPTPAPIQIPMPSTPPTPSTAPPSS